MTRWKEKVGSFEEVWNEAQEYVPLEIVFWIYDTLENNFWNEIDYTKYMKDSCRLCLD